MLELRKKGNKHWLLIDDEIGEFSPSKFTINRLNNVINIIYFNNLKSKEYNVSDCYIFDIDDTSGFNTSDGVAFMDKLEELNCPCFQKDVNNFYISGGSWSELTNFDALNDSTLPLSGAEQIPIIQGGETKKVAVSEFQTDVSGKLDKVSTAGVERAYIINADGSQGTKATSEISETKPNAIGDIYNKNTWGDTSDFTTFGDASVSLSGSYINIGSATNGSFNNYIKFSRATNLNKYRMTIEFKIINAPSSTTFGLGLGLRSLNSRPLDSYHYVAQIGLPSTAANKRIYVYTGITTYTLRLTSGTDATFALNDIIRLTVEQDINVITCNFLNLTTGNTQVSTYTFPMVAPYLPNTGNFVIHILGGTYEMRKLAVESKDYENAKLICVGDSKTAGYFADSFATSFGNQLANYSKGISVNAGGSDKTAEVLLKIPELIALKPKRILLNIGSNDKRYGVTYATWQANYDSIVSQLETAGIEVYHLLQLNENVLNFSDYNSHIISTYDSSKVIDAGIISLNADGVHPNQQAMNHIFYTVLSKIKLD